ncbi:hypothetical protein G9A89_018991 [Geosiphon pyriformis]|nr:hypothetical protein G9A89_018991 [Geosiphon pyriformis]
MSVGLCSSPNFDESSYFGNLHSMPGSYIPTPAAESTRSPGYFDLNPKRPSGTSSPFFESMKTQSSGPTPFYDCEQFRLGTDTPNNNSNTNTFNNPNTINNLRNKFTNTQLPATPGSMTPGFTLKLPSSFKEGMVTPSWVTNGVIRATLPGKAPRSATVKRPSTHNLSSLALSTQAFDAYSVEKVAELIKRQNSQSQKQESLILLLDLRSFSNFTAGRIRGALNICIPSTLLKRCSFSPEKILDTLVSDYDKDIFKNWANFENIILYDNDLNAMSENCSIFHVCKKFKKENSNAKIGWLKGGFLSFSDKYRELCEDASVGLLNPNPPTTLPRRRTADEKRKPGPFTCPTPIIEISGVNPFFSNIRQNYELSVGITETIPIRIPEGIKIDRSKLPAFMDNLVYSEGGRGKLARNFHDIELTEQRRLQSLMLHNSNQATADCPFSISAGMEKGAKNRYNNIWPYDHARVKLDHPVEGGCDYVNASYVQAKGCETRYIATQGPLPATYNDFWRVIWEQDSRVIVMLTKEEEAGRIQCHRYWAECTKKPCVYGNLSCLLLSETTPCFTPDGLPDKTIIIRKFLLTNTQTPFALPREISQIHFLGWPDFGIPESPFPILKLIDIANETQSRAIQTSESKSIGPMIVHCSAGCGRTGAFCTIDSVLRLIENGRTKGQVLNPSKDIIKSTIESFREQRLSMVQSLRQYVFCYEAVLWKLVGAA